MKQFTLHQPTKICFGWGRVSEVGEIVSHYGQSCLLVTGHTSKAKLPIYENIKGTLKSKDIKVFHFDGVVTNPTTDIVNEGTGIAVNQEVEVVLGVGGGSSMDTAKAIAVGATHEGEAWDYRLFTDKQITEKTLPIITVSTTSGTGSQVTPFSVVTNPTEKSKFALANPLLSPRASIVDPELMVTVPEHITASTGFDAFAHAFESYIHDNASPYTDMLAIKAMETVVKYLPIVMDNSSNREARAQMSWADTLAGLCISNAGTTLPHGIGMAIGGHAPKVLHGEALSVIYPEFMRYSYGSALGKFATLARILNPNLENEYDEVAAQRSCEEMDKFLKRLGMWFELDELEIPEAELSAIADDSVELPDYRANPRVPTRNEILEMLERSYNHYLSQDSKESR